MADGRTAGLRFARVGAEQGSTSADFRPAMPVVPPRQGARRARRDGLLRRIATGITALTAMIAVLVVAAAAVAFAIG
jgi:hypothetical protein